MKAMHHGDLQAGEGSPQQFLVNVQNLQVTYGRGENAHIALREMNLQMKAGETLAVIGETGSGKSTLGRFLLGLLDPSASVHPDTSYTFAEQRVTPELIKTLRGRSICRIAQNPLRSLNPVRRCGVQVAEVIKLLAPQISSIERKRQVIAVFAKLMLKQPNQIFEAYPHQLSIGQLQRVMISMSVLAAPELIIADEPFSSVDSITKKTLVDLLHVMQEEYGFTLLLITHDLSLLESLASRWLVLRNGIVQGVGTDNFLTAPHHHPYLQSLVEQYQKLQAVKSSQQVPSPPVLQLDKLGYAYRELSWMKERVSPVFDGITLDIAAGEIFGIVGLSGSGKSTLARIMGGLLQDYKGICKMSGVEVSSYLYNRLPYFRRVQYIMQDAGSSLPARMPMRTVLALALRAFYPKLAKAQADVRMKELLAMVTLKEELLSRYRHQLSGGEMQRFAIARALCATPDVLIMDETLSDLDQAVQGAILEVLTKLNQEQGLTIILVAHDLRLVRHSCDRILVMGEGQQIALGSWEVIQGDRSSYVRSLLTAL